MRIVGFLAEPFVEQHCFDTALWKERSLKIHRDQVTAGRISIPEGPQGITGPEGIKDKCTLGAIPLSVTALNHLSRLRFWPLSFGRSSGRCTDCYLHKARRGARAGGSWIPPEGELLWLIIVQG